jgi:hypothetical protein
MFQLDQKLTCHWALVMPARTTTADTACAKRMLWDSDACFAPKSVRRAMRRQYPLSAKSWSSIRRFDKPMFESSRRE